LDFLHIRPVSRAFAAFIHGADASITWLASSYAKSIHVALRLRYLLLLVFLAGLGATCMDVPACSHRVHSAGGSGLHDGDRAGAAGILAGLHRALAERAEHIIAQNPDVSGAFAIIGFNFSGSASNAGMMFVNTKPSDQRRGKGHSTADIIADLSPKLQMLMLVPERRPGCHVPTAGGAGRGQLRRLPVHAAGPGRQHAQRPGPRGAPDRGRQQARKDLTGLLTTFSANDPQELVTIDREKAKTMNIPLSQITNTLSVFMGSEYINDFDYNNRTYRVYVQADQPFRMTASDLHSYYVRSDSGQMVPLDNLVTVKESAGPPVITHYNLFRAVEIDGSPAPGYSSGRDWRRWKIWPQR
jgi:HAE1 family hydrophobic/amphiphilic exporter-1